MGSFDATCSASRASEDDRAEFLNVAAEFAFVHHCLSILRHVWRPLTTTGPSAASGRTT